MKKFNIQGIFFSIFACVTYQAYGMQQILQHIKNILDTDNISFVTSHSQDQKNTNLTITRLDLYYGNILIGTSTYRHETHKQWIYLATLEATRWKNRGIGEQLFYLTMYNIAQQYPNKPNVTMVIFAYDAPLHLSFYEKNKMIFAFYRRVGTMVDKSTNTGDINLKDAGYYDEN